MNGRVKVFLASLMTLSLLSFPGMSFADDGNQGDQGGPPGFVMSSEDQAALNQAPADQSAANPGSEVETEATASGASLPFQDLANAPWAQGAASLLSQQGIVQGVGNGQFDPSGTLTRAQAATMIGRFLGRSGWKGQSGEKERENEAYRDAPAWAKQIIGGLAKDGLLFNGSQNNFDPNRAATRAWVTAQIVQALGLDNLAKGYTSADLTFEDAASIPDWAVGPVVLAVKDGIIQGEPAPDGGQVFDPSGQLTRAQMVVMLSRAEQIKAAGSDVVNGVVVSINAGGTGPVAVGTSVYGTTYWPTATLGTTVGGSVYGSTYGGATVTIQDAKTGQPATYPVEPNARIFDQGAATLNQISAGDRVTALLDQSGAIAVLDDHAPRLDQLTGTVELANRSGKHVGWLMVQTADGQNVEVLVLERSRIEGNGSGNLPFLAIQSGDQVQIAGRVDGKNFLAATVNDLNQNPTATVPTTSTSATGSGLTGDVSAGQTEFQSACSSCHGSAPNFNYITAGNLQSSNLITESVLASWIQQNMPAGNSNTLTTTQATNLADYILTTEGLVSTTTGSSTSNQSSADTTALSGQSLYAQYCSGCHGDSGQGTAIAPSIEAKVPHNMPYNDPSALNSDQRAAILNYLLSLPNFGKSSGEGD